MEQESNEVFTAVFSIASVILGAILAWASTVHFQTRSKRSEERRLLTVLFGELLNLKRHYFYAFDELPTELGSKAEILSLKMSRYGPLAVSGSDLSHLGFVRETDIRDLMQLALVVRNTDYAIELALEDYSSETQNKDNIEGIRRRMKFTASVVDRLIHSISSSHPNLKKIISNNN